MASPDSWKPEDFPCTLTLHIPFPTARLSSTALRALAVDAELSPLVRRSFALTVPTTSTSTSPPTTSTASTSAPSSTTPSDDTVLSVTYAATTHRMLRVAVNGFIESVGVVIGVMRDLDTDVVYEPVREGLEGVQGLEVG